MEFLLETLFYRFTNVLKEALSLSLPIVKVLSSDNSHSRSLLPVLIFLSPLTEGAVCIPCQSLEELSVISHSFLKSVTRLRELKKDYYFMYPAYFTVQKKCLLQADGSTHILDLISFVSSSRDTINF